MAFPHNLDPTMPGLWDREKLAFTLWVARLIAHANGGVDLSELGLMSKLFTDETLLAYGIIDADGEITPTWDRARDAALTELHTRLPLAEKLELITVFHDVCLSDGELVQAELLVLREAAEALGVGVQPLAAHLRSLRSSTR